MRQALRIAAFYLLLSAAWIYFSDQAVAALADTPEAASRLQTLKGWFFVLGSSLLIWALAWREVRTVTQSEARYRSLVEHAPDAIFVSRSGRVVLANQECGRLLGVPDAAALVGRTSLDFFHPDDHPSIRERARILEQEGRAVPLAEERIVRADGDVVPVAVRAAPFPYDGGHAIHVILRDITDQKAAEEAIRALNQDLTRRVEERTAELAAQNRELETFTYSVSHDLKAPVRTLEGYSHLLLTDHAQGLGPEGRAFAERIQAAAVQMGRLIEDLLAYSRIERRSPQVAPVHLRRMAEEIVQSRGEEIRSRDVDVVLDVPDVTVMADAAGLALVLRNLVDNALKFTRDVARPQLTILVQVRDGRRVLEVRDNGVGFDMKFHDQIFNLFERLPGSEEYPGTGIGLAMARKAAERMHGHLWAEGRPGEGAAFFLTLPPVHAP